MFARGPEALDAKEQYGSDDEMLGIWRRTIMATENAQHLELSEMARSANRSPQQQLQLEEFIGTKLKISSWAAEQLGRRIALSTAPKGQLLAKAGTPGFVIPEGDCLPGAGACGPSQLVALSVVMPQGVGPHSWWSSVW